MEIHFSGFRRLLKNGQRQTRFLTLEVTLYIYHTTQKPTYVYGVQGSK